MPVMRRGVIDAIVLAARRVLPMDIGSRTPLQLNLLNEGTLKTARELYLPGAG